MSKLDSLRRLSWLIASLSCIFSPGARAEGPDFMRLVEPADDKALVLNLRLNRTPIGDSIVAYQDAKRLMLPLNGVFQALEIAITADAESGKASGFFIREDRRFVLDLAARTATLGSRAFVLQPGTVERQPTDIYVDSTLFDKWFSIRLHLDMEDLALVVSSLELLPVQERLERERRRDGAHRSIAEDGYEIKEPPARLVDWPFVDTEIEVSTNRAAGQQTQQAQYSSVVTGQIAGLDLDMAANGSIAGASPTMLRATVGRRDPRGGLLGPVDAREALVGDISTPNLPLVANSVAGRGATLSTFNLHRLSDLQRVTLRGDLPLGWEVELYRGGDLIDFQTSGSDGRYEFANVPTIPGLNAFKLVFYGPQGQRREEDQPIYVAASTVGAGETGFRLAMNQQNVDLINGQLNRQQQLTPFNRFDLLARNQVLNESPFNDGKLRVIGEIEHGISDTLSLTGALSDIPFNGTNYQYVQTGLRTNILGALVTLNDSVSNTGDVAYGLGLQGEFHGLSWLMSHDRFEHNFLSERSFDQILNRPLRSFSAAQLTGLFPDFGIGALPFATSATYGTARDGATRAELDGRISSYFGRFTIGSETRTEIVTNTPTQTTEILRLGTTFGRIGLRGEAIYDLGAPQPGLNAARVTADFQVKPDVNLRLGAVRFEQAPRQTQLVMGGDVLFNKLALGADASLSTHGDFSVLLKLGFSFGIDPRDNGLVVHGENFARSGAVSPRVFLDRNGDGVFGPGDELLPNVRFRGPGVPFKNQTDRTGTTLITNLESYRETPIAIDPESLEDPYWRAGEQKVAVLPRPGSVLQLDFPVYETGEVDGTVEVERASGRHTPLPGIRLQVVDDNDKVIVQTLSGYDGSFYLEGVRLGRYRLRPDPEQLERLHLAPMAARLIELTRDSPSVAAGVITLSNALAPVVAKAAPDAGLPTAVPASPLVAAATPAHTIPISSVPRVEPPGALHAPSLAEVQAPATNDVLPGLRPPTMHFLDTDHLASTQGARQE
jgi:hypothetical protein